MTKQIMIGSELVNLIEQKNGTYNVATGKVDPLTNSASFMSEFDYQLHDGYVFLTQGFGTVNNGGTLQFGVTCGTVRVPHVTLFYQSTSRMEFYMFEDSEFTGGVVTMPINANRNSSKEPTAVTVASPTVTDDGTLLLSQSVGKEGATPATGSNVGQAELAAKFILGAGKKYILRAISRDDGNIINYAAVTVDDGIGG